MVFFLFVLPVHAEHEPEISNPMPNPMSTPCPDPPSKDEAKNYYCYDKDGIIRFPTEPEPMYVPLDTTTEKGT